MSTEPNPDSHSRAYSNEDFLEAYEFLFNDAEDALANQLYEEIADLAKRDIEHAKSLFQDGITSKMKFMFLGRLNLIVERDISAGLAMIDQGLEMTTDEHGIDSEILGSVGDSLKAAMQSKTIPLSESIPRYAKVARLWADYERGDPSPPLTPPG